MVLWGWLVRLVSGFLPVDGKRIGKIIWVIIICAVVIGAYHKLFIAKTQHTEFQQGSTQIINQCPEDSKVLGVGVNIWKLKIKVGI